MISHLVFFCFTQVACVAQLVYKLPEGITVSSSLLPFTAPGTDVDAEEKHFKYNLDWFCRKICTLISLTRMEWHWIEWNCWWTLSVLTWMTVDLPETSQIKRDQKKKRKKKKLETTDSLRMVSSPATCQVATKFITHRTYKFFQLRMLAIQKRKNSVTECIYIFLFQLLRTPPFPKNPKLWLYSQRRLVCEWPRGIWYTEGKMVPMTSRIISSYKCKWVNP